MTRVNSRVELVEYHWSEQSKKMYPKPLQTFKMEPLTVIANLSILEVSRDPDDAYGPDCRTGLECDTSYKYSTIGKSNKI